MELREYLQILRRRWWLPVCLCLLTTLFSIWQLKPWQPAASISTYTTSVRVLVTVMPDWEQGAKGYYDPRYFAWLTSEYLVDDFTEVVQSGLFAQKVSERLKTQGIEMSAGAVEATGTTNKRHRILTLTFNGGDRQQLEAIAQAALAEIKENASFYFRQLAMENASITALDEPQISEIRSSVVRRQFELPLRALLGLMIGLALLFFLDYLDTSIRGRHDVELLGLTVLGEIPKIKMKG